MLHDLESCYWILLWFFLLHIPLHALADYEPTNQHGVSMDIFPEERVVVPAPRLMAIDNNDFISETMSKIHPSMRPASPGVQKVAQAIIFGHEAIQKNDSISTSIGEAFYSAFSARLDEIINSVPNHEVEFITNFEEKKEKALAAVQAAVVASANTGAA